MTGYPLIVRHKFSIFSPASWQSLLIRILDKCWANHCAVILDLKGERFVVEARGYGVFMATWDNWIKHRPNKEWKIGIPKWQVPADIENRILKSLGASYDKESLYIWHPYRLITGNWKGGRSVKGDLTCSELIGLYWKERFPNNWFRLTTGDIVRSGLFRF